VLIPVAARIAQCQRDVILDSIWECWIIAIKYKRRLDVPNIESQPFLHDPEAGGRQTLMVFNLITPKFL